MAKINLQNIKKSYGSNTVIHNLSADIADGELIVIVGPSGCGKSTLLRMVAGLEEINSGEIIINDKKMNDLEPMERNIAMVFQNYALYPHMTVFENMSYGLKIQKTPKDEIISRVNEAAEILGARDAIAVDASRAKKAPVERSESVATATSRGRRDVAVPTPI